MARRTVPFYHPGEILLYEYLNPLNLSADSLAKELHVAPEHIEELIAGNKPITSDLALRLARFFNTTPHYWLTIQNNFDLNISSLHIQEEMQKIRPHSLHK